MWADTLVVVERGHFLRLAIWGGTSLVAGAVILAIVAVLSRRRGRAPLLYHFAVQGIAWGGLELAIAAFALRSLPLRDVGSATRLVGQLWFKAGLDVGVMAAGLTLALTAWLLESRGGSAAASVPPAKPDGPRWMAPVGAGLGILLQGAAMLILDLYFLSAIAV